MKLIRLVKHNLKKYFEKAVNPQMQTSSLQSEKVKSDLNL